MDQVHGSGLQIRLNSRQIDSKNVNSEVFGGTPWKVVEVEKKQLTSETY